METITDQRRAIEALRALPEQATIEDAIERLCFMAKIEEGLRQSDAGQLVSHDEVKKQFLSRGSFSGPIKPARIWPPFKRSSVKILRTTTRSSFPVS